MLAKGSSVRFVDKTRYESAVVLGLSSKELEVY